MKKICKECGKEFETTKNNKKYCSEECREIYFSRKSGYSRPDPERLKYIKELDRTDHIKQIAEKVKAERSTAEQTPPYLAETNLANYITELEQKLSQIDSTVQLYKQMIDDNNRERAWLSEHIDRLKHIIICEGHKCRSQNSASLIEQNQ